MAGDGFSWGGGSSGSWNDPTYWLDTTTDQLDLATPGATNDVTLYGDGGLQLSGNATIASLTLTGGVVDLTGDVTTALFSGAGSTLIATGGALVQIGSVSGSAWIEVDAHSSLEIGGGDSAVAGELVIDAGATLADATLYAPLIVNDGGIDGGPSIGWNYSSPILEGPANTTDFTNAGQISNSVTSINIWVANNFTNTTAGIITLAAPYESSISATNFQNDGLITVSNHDSLSAAAFTGRGVIELDAGAVLNLTGQLDTNLSFVGLGADLELQSAQDPLSTIGGRIEGFAAGDAIL
jgi:hypothetical protein